MDCKFQIALSFATEDQDFVEKVYHYLKAEKLSVFFAPSPEGQAYLSGKNQREAFYEIFGLRAEGAALFVSKDYISRKVPMEEAGIALAKHGNDGKVIPIYLDKAQLPQELFDPGNANYFRSHNPAVVAAHLAAKFKEEPQQQASPKSEKLSHG